MSGQILVNFQTISQAATDVRTTANNIKRCWTTSRPA